MAYSNSLLDGLPRADQARILKCCVPVDLELTAVLCESEQPMEHVYFPLTGYISLVMTLGKHPPLEMGLIGSEGLLGATLALGISTARLRGVVQGAGTALRMTAAQARRELKRSPAVTRMFHRYVSVLLAQLSRTAACTRFHHIDTRLARWLLMTHDRAHGDRFHLTHAFLADMLGVQRSAVTIAAGALQAGNIISYTRGDIRILNRKGLEARSCNCYGAISRDYAAVFA